MYSTKFLERAILVIVNNKNPKPKFPLGKSTWIIITCAVSILALSTVTVSATGCSPVSLQLKAWAIEYKLQKGGCSFPEIPQ